MHKYRSNKFRVLFCVIIVMLQHSEALFGWGKNKHHKTKKTNNNDDPSTNEDDTSIQNNLDRVQSFFEEIRVENLQRFQSDDCSSLFHHFDEDAVFYTPKSELNGSDEIEEALQDRCGGVQKSFGEVHNVKFDIESFKSKGLIFSGTMMETIIGTFKNETEYLRYTYVLKEIEGGGLKILYRHDSIQN